MTDLNNIISTFTKEEQQKFINYLQKKNKRTDTKNIDLFHYLLDNTLNSKAICIKLYGTQKQAAYHALRKRLYQSVIRFTAKQRLQDEGSINMQIIEYILAAKSFLQQKQVKVACNLLQKAEILANKHALFALLNEIYHTQIQYAHTNPDLVLENLLLKFKNNQLKLQQEDALNIIYAKVRAAINSATYKGEVTDFETIIKTIFKEQRITVHHTLSFKSLYQIVKLASDSVFVTKNYLKIEPFLITTYKTILNHNNQEKQIFYHIQILYTISDTLFRNKKFNESLSYLKTMHSYMRLQQNKHYPTFTLKYHLLLALNLNYNNKPLEAIQTLKPTVTKKYRDTETWHDIQLSLIVFYFQQNMFKKANNILSSLFHTDSWYTEKVGKEWVIKKNLIEILLHIELKNTNLVESRLISFKRSYQAYLKNINQTRVITYLNFVSIYYKHPESVTSASYKNKVEQAFNWTENYNDDIFVISFYSWLKGKMTNTNVFTVTLNLIKQAQQKLSLNQ